MNRLLAHQKMYPINPLSLIELQKSLQQYLLNDDNSIDAFTLETEKFSKQQRLTIYQEAYRLRLIDALKNDYPALHLLLNNIAFEQLLHEYTTAHPSQHPSLRWLGEKLPFFCAAIQTGSNIFMS